MRGMNKVFLVGRLGQDPELRHGREGGTPWCAMSVATNRSRRQGDEWVEETDWHRVKVFGTQAELCHRYLRKGGVVAVEGSISYRRYTAEDGSLRLATSVLADRVTFVRSGRAAAPEEERSAAAG